MKFHVIFADWRARPGRSQAWREERRANFPTEDQWRREYPETIDDVLLAAEEMVFSTSALTQAQQGATGPSAPLLGDYEGCQPCRGQGWVGSRQRDQLLQLKCAHCAGEGRVYTGAHRYIKAWDIGRMQDAAVGVVLDVTRPPYQLVAYRRFMRRPYPELQLEIEALHNLYPGETYIEDNNAGQAVRENLKVPATGFNTTTATKVQAIMALKVGFESGWLKVYREPQLIFELSSYMWNDKELIQDSVIALAIATFVAGPPLVHIGRPVSAPTQSRLAGISATRPAASRAEVLALASTSRRPGGTRGRDKAAEYINSREAP